MENPVGRATDILQLMAVRRGHFLFESGHHGKLWLDLELLCANPVKLRPFLDVLAAKVKPYSVERVCGPLIEGAFVALMLAESLSLEFAYSERQSQDRQSKRTLFKASYRVPTLLRAQLSGKRVAVVNDVTNAGSAIRATIADLEACGAKVTLIASLLTLGDAAQRFAQEKSIAIESVSWMANQLWTPDECLLCREGLPLQDVANFKSHLGYW
jgi:orotate phosphoribosyltransferase